MLEKEKVMHLPSVHSRLPVDVQIELRVFLNLSFLSIFHSFEAGNCVSNSIFKRMKNTQIMSLCTKLAVNENGLILME